MSSGNEIPLGGLYKMRSWKRCGSYDALHYLFYIIHTITMKRLFLFLSFICTFYSAQADYEATTLPELITRSAIIVRGTIKEVGASNITITLQALLKGKLTDSSLVIEKFRDWTCAQRFAPYARGQEVVFFLSEQDGNYKILGAGDEGEIPIVKNQAYYRQLYLNIDAATAETEIYKANRSGYAYRVIDLEQAIRYYDQHHRNIKTALQKNKNYNLQYLKNPVLNRIIAELQV